MEFKCFAGRLFAKVWQTNLEDCFVPRFTEHSLSIHVFVSVRKMLVGCTASPKTSINSKMLGVASLRKETGVLGTGPGFCTEYWKESLWL